MWILLLWESVTPWHWVIGFRRSEAVTLPRNLKKGLPSNVTSYDRITDAAATPQRKPKNSNFRLYKDVNQGLMK